MFEHLLMDWGHWNEFLVQDLSTGFDLIGELPKSGFSGIILDQPRFQVVTWALRQRRAEKPYGKLLAAPVTRGWTLFREAAVKELKKGFLEGFLNIADLPEDAFIKTFYCSAENKVRPTKIIPWPSPRLSQCTPSIMLRPMVAYWLKAYENKPGRSALKAKRWDLSDA